MATKTTHENPLMSTVFAAMAAKTLHAATELGVPALLARGPMTPGELASATGADGLSLGRIMRALAGLGVLEQAAEGDRYALNGLGDALRPDAPGSVHAVLTMLCGPENWRSWGELEAGVRTGKTPWALANGMTWTEFYERNPEQAGQFNRAMAEHTRAAAPALLDAAGLDRFASVMDVGGGDGTLLAEALRAHPGLVGGVLDLPAGLADARATLATAGVAGRARLEAGDFFASVPPGADAYLLKQVLHDWDDESAVAILRNVRRAMEPAGRVLVFERSLPELVGEDDLPTLLLDVLMLTVTGGRERTEREFAELFTAAGLEAPTATEAIPPFGYRVFESTTKTDR